MGAQITTILADATTVIVALAAGVGDVAGFMIANPLIAISIGLSLTVMTIGVTRGFVRK